MPDMIQNNTSDPRHNPQKNESLLRQRVANTLADSTSSCLRLISHDMGKSTPLTTTCSSSKKVSFSLHSQVRVYPIDKEEDRQKSYSSLERKMFQAQARLDSLRIQFLMQTCPYEGVVAISYLMDLHLVAYEDLLGIENLVLGVNIGDKRHKHSRSVMKAHYELQQTDNAVADVVLAKGSFTRRLGNIEKACSQAAMAA